MPATPFHETPIPRLAVLACSVFEQEIAALTAGAEHLREVCWFEIGLHDNPDRLRSVLQATIDRVDARADIDAIVLVYGLCGRGTAGLRAGAHRLVIARAHDCITHFLGSKEAYAAHQRACPTCYYYTPGWNRARRVPGPDRQKHLRVELATRFDRDDLDFLLEAEREQWARHDTATFIDLGTSDAPAEADYARGCAHALGWRFEQIHGDPALLRDLLWGRWSPERFQVVGPGMVLTHLADERIMGVSDASATDHK